MEEGGIISAMKLAPFPSPRVLVLQWEAGEIKREELQRLMALHQAAILEEAEEERANPVASYVDRMMNKRMAKKLINAHGEANMRELCLALSEVPEFLPIIGIFRYIALFETSASRSFGFGRFSCGVIGR